MVKCRGWVACCVRKWFRYSDHHKLRLIYPLCGLDRSSPPPHLLKIASIFLVLLSLFPPIAWQVIFLRLNLVYFAVQILACVHFIFEHGIIFGFHTCIPVHVYGYLFGLVILYQKLSRYLFCFIHIHWHSSFLSPLLPKFLLLYT